MKTNFLRIVGMGFAFLLCATPTMAKSQLGSVSVDLSGCSGTGSVWFDLNNNSARDTGETFCNGDTISNTIISNAYKYVTKNGATYNLTGSRIVSIVKPTSAGLYNGRTPGNTGTYNFEDSTLYVFPKGVMYLFSGNMQPYGGTDYTKTPVYVGEDGVSLQTLTYVPNMGSPARTLMDNLGIYSMNIYSGQNTLMFFNSIIQSPTVTYASTSGYLFLMNTYFKGGQLATSSNFNPSIYLNNSALEGNNFGINNTVFQESINSFVYNNTGTSNLYFNGYVYNSAIFNNSVARMLFYTACSVVYTYNNAVYNNTNVQISQSCNTAGSVGIMLNNVFFNNTYYDVSSQNFFETGLTKTAKNIGSHTAGLNRLISNYVNNGKTFSQVQSDLGISDIPSCTTNKDKQGSESLSGNLVNPCDGVSPIKSFQTNIN